MEVVDLNERLLIPQRIDFADVGIGRDKLPQQHGRFSQGDPRCF
jgi:hypothetical protein